MMLILNDTHDAFSLHFMQGMRTSILLDMVTSCIMSLVIYANSTISLL